MLDVPVRGNRLPEATAAYTPAGRGTPPITTRGREIGVSAKTANGPQLLPETEKLAQGKNFASVATVLPNGLIQNQVIWVDARDGKILLNTEVHRKKALNIKDNPVITVLIRDESDPYRYAEVRGRVTNTLTGDEARQHIDQVSQKYTDGPYPPENIKTERVILEITADRQTFIDQNQGVAPE
jgi:PPOX class probable F420-dependent enzyme